MATIICRHGPALLSFADDPIAGGLRPQCISPARDRNGGTDSRRRAAGARRRAQGCADRRRFREPQRSARHERRPHRPPRSCGWYRRSRVPAPLKVVALVVAVHGANALPCRQCGGVGRIPERSGVSISPRRKQRTYCCPQVPTQGARRPPQRGADGAGIAPCCSGWYQLFANPFARPSAQELPLL